MAPTSCKRVNTVSDNCTKRLHYTHPGHSTVTQCWHTDKSHSSSFFLSCPVWGFSGVFDLTLFIILSFSPSLLPAFSDSSLHLSTTSICHSLNVKVRMSWLEQIWCPGLHHAHFDQMDVRKTTTICVFLTLIATNNKMTFTTVAR